MKRVVIQFLAIAAAFFALWFLLSRIPFTGLLHIEEFSRTQEQKLGNRILDELTDEYHEIESDSVRDVVIGFASAICRANGIPDTSVHVHIIDVGNVNAFALPGRHLIVNSGLIIYCQSPEELCGVLAHEIAHIEHRHVMKKLTKEIGYSMLTTLSGGSSSGAILKQTARMLSSTSFDRDQERDADTTAVRYLKNASIDPVAFANMLYRMVSNNEAGNRGIELLSTHPNSADRSAEILGLCQSGTGTYKPVMEPKAWERFKSKLLSKNRNTPEE